MSEGPRDKNTGQAEEGIVLRNSSPARVSFNEKTGKAQRNRNLFNDDQAEHAPQDDSLHGESNRIIKEDERLLHVEDSSFKPAQPLRLEIEPSESTLVQADDELPAAHRLQVEVDTPDDNRLHQSESAPIEATQLKPSDAPAPDHHERLPESASASHRELLPEAEQVSHHEKLTITAPDANHQALLEQPASLLPPDLPSLELTAPNVVHVETETETEAEADVGAEAGVAAQPELLATAPAPAPEMSQAVPVAQETPPALASVSARQAPSQVPPAAKPHARRVHLSMDVHQRERMAEAAAENAAIDERLHHAEERVIKLTDQILKGSR